MEARALAELAVDGFSASAVAGSSTMASTRARICSIFSKSANSMVLAKPWGVRSALASLARHDELADDVGPAVVDHVLGLERRRTPAC